MKSVMKVMLMLVLAVILAVGAWGEEAEPVVEAEVPATGISVAVSEKEFKPGSYDVIVLVPYDTKDTMLTDPAKLEQVKIAVALIADNLQGSGSTLRLARTSAKTADEFIDVPLSGKPQDWGSAVDTLTEGDPLKNKLDSRLKDSVVLALENASDKTVLLVLGDGILDTTANYAAKKVPDIMKETGAHVVYRAVDIIDQEKAGKTETCIKDLLGVSADYVELATEGAGVEIAEDVFEAVEEDIDLVKLAGMTAETMEESGVVDAAFVIRDDGKMSASFKSGNSADAYGRVREFEIAASSSDEVYEAGKPVSIILTNAYGGLDVTYEMDGEEISLTEDGSIPALEAGDYAVTVKAANAELSIAAHSEEVMFETVAAPTLSADAAEFVLYADASTEYSYCVEEAVLTELFATGESFEAETASRDMDVSVDENNALWLTGEPEAAETDVVITVSATDKYGFSGSGDIAVKVMYLPEMMKGITLVPDAEIDAVYKDGDEIVRNFTVEDAALAEAMDLCLDEGWELSCVYRIDGGEEVAMNGSLEDGWEMETVAEAGMGKLEVFLLPVGESIEDADPAWTCETFNIYTAEELVESRMEGVELNVETEPEYPINAVVLANVNIKDLAALTGAHDYADYEFELVVAGEDIVAKAEGYTLHDAPVTVDGNISDGWSIEMPAHCTVNMSVQLKAVKSGEEFASAAHEFVVTVADADLLRKVACIVDGKELWEEPNMMKLYIIAGGVVVLLVIVVIVVINLNRKKFRGYLTMEVVVDGRTYKGKAIELAVWEKKAVNFGTLLSGSGLPPIAELTSPDIMNNIKFVPVKNGVRVANKSKALKGDGKALVMSDNSTVQFTTVNNSMTLKLAYKISAGEGA